MVGEEKGIFREGPEVKTPSVGPSVDQALVESRSFLALERK